MDTLFLQRMEWATELLREFREHEKSGKGAFTFRGQMIVRTYEYALVLPVKSVSKHQFSFQDMPLVKQAENIIVMQEKITKND